MGDHAVFIWCMSGVSICLRASSLTVRRLSALSLPGMRSTGGTSLARCRASKEGIEQVQRSRFVFLAAPLPSAAGGSLAGGSLAGGSLAGGSLAGSPLAEGVVWILVSPNNRPLGRGATYHERYVACYEAVLSLRENFSKLTPVETTVDQTGQWTWRVEVGGEPVAVSSRSYLRVRECSYNLERFLEAAPTADIVPGTRSARRGRHPAADPPPPAHYPGPPHRTPPEAPRWNAPIRGGYAR